MDFPTEKNPIADVEIPICDTCGKPTVPTHIDDAKTQWYKCEQGHQTSTPMKQKFNAVGRGQNLPQENKKENQKYGCGSHYATDDTDKFNPNSFANYLTGQFFFKTDKKTDLMYVYNLEALGQK